MVGIVGGGSIGLELGSLAMLGKLGTPGDGAFNPQLNAAGERAWVNVATGNLVVQDRDEFLAGVGPLLRTYNSQGLFDDDNGDKWRLSVEERAILSGAANAAGSFITRTGADGSAARYAFDGARNLYVSGAGAGASDTIASANGQFLWTDGDTGVVEVYEGGGAGRLLARRDPSGNTVQYNWGADGLIASVGATSADGTVESLLFSYSGVNLASVARATTGGAGTDVSTLVRYTYDSLGRLATVSYDLSPGDNSIADGRVYTTRYSYVDASKYLAAVEQPDGSRLSFSWTPTGDGGYRVDSITDGFGRVTRYLWSDSQCRVVDPFGAVTTFDRDAAGQLIRITDATGLATSLVYDGDGNVVSVLQPGGPITTYAYDANGNRVLERDRLGNAVTREFDARNQLIAETVWVTAATPLVTRHVYDAQGRNQLRFVVAADGGVTEYRYDPQGRRSAQLQFPSDRYNVAGNPAEADLAAWTAARAGRAVRTDMRYDLTGQPAQVIRYAQVDAAGNGIADGSESVTRTLYDARGRLLKTIAPDGGVSTFVYDGLGRVVAGTDATGQLTTSQYDDARNSITTTLANGLRRTEVRAPGGLVIARTESDAAGLALASTQYVYDADTRLVMSTDPVGSRTFFLYDAAGRKVGEVAGDGILTETVWSANDEVDHIVTWANRIDAGQLVDASGAPVPCTLAQLRPARSPVDRVEWKVWDLASRLVKTIDAQGAVTEYRFDGAGRVTAEIRFATPWDMAGRDLTVAANLSMALIDPPATAGDAVRHFRYDAAGRLRAAIDSTGGLVEHRYDAAGREVQRIVHGRGAGAFGSSTTLEEVLAYAGTDANDRITTWFYNAAGQVAGEVDASGGLTETVYDAAGHRVREVRYATLVAGGAGLSADTPLASIRPASSAQDQVRTWEWDAAGRMTRSVDAGGMVTVYRYDTVGNLVGTTRAQGTRQAGTLTARYDAQGRLIGELDAIGSAMLTGNQTAAEIDAIWAARGVAYGYDAAGHQVRRTNANGVVTTWLYDAAGRRSEEHVDANGLNLVTRFAYDAAGNLVRRTDPAGNTTRYVFDADNRLVFTVDAAGGVVEQCYDNLDRVVKEVRHASALNLAGLDAAAGGATGSVATVADVRARLVATAADVVTQRVFDREGRVLATIDAQGGVVQFSYDASGNVLTRTACANRIDLNTWVPGTLPAVVADPANDQTVRTVYDGLNRTLYTINGTGALSRRVYDAFGNIVRRIDYATPLASQADPAAVPASVDDRITTMAYDAANRVVLTIDPVGAVTRNTYDALGHVVATTLYAQTVAIGTGLAMASVDSVTAAALAQQPSAGDRTTRFTYDLAGNLLTRADALGNNESWTWDALGRKTSYTDAAGSVWSYAYDAAGRLLTETSPQTQLTTTRPDASGKLVASSVVAGLVTRNTWDALGNLVARTEAVGRPEERTTRYEYDVLGRRIRTIYPPVGVYDAASDGLNTAGLAPRVESVRSLQTEVGYDVFGNAIRSTDLAGNVTTRTYDRLGNVIAETGPSGIATTWVRNAFGGIESHTDTAGGQSRTTRYVYDQAGRLIRRIDPQIAAFDPDAPAAQQAITAGAITETVYDAFGNAVLTATLKNPATNTWLVSGQRFDARGQVVASVDAGGYLTTQTWDAAGNLASQTSYATATAWSGLVTSSVVGQFTPGALPVVPGVPTSSTSDRITRFTWDALGRKTSATRVGVITATADTAPVRQDRTEQYSYDALGHRIRTIDALGNSTWSYYDALGRLRATALTDVGAADDGSLLTPLVTYGRDALGNVVAETHYANGVTGLSTTGYTAPASSTDDRITLTAFDALGHAVQSTDARGINRYSSYDAAGHVAKAWQAFTSPGGMRTVHQILRYDAAGHQISRSEAAVPVFDPVTGTIRTVTPTETRRYDAWGNLTAVTDANGNTTQSWYDVANNRTATLSAAGELTTWQYDLAGHVVVQQVFNELVSPASSGAIPAAQTPTDVRITLYRYDALGRQTEARTPNMLLGRADVATGNLAIVSSDVVVRKDYDAFGNVRRLIDGNGGTTTTWYDTAGQPILTVDPEGYGIVMLRDAKGNNVREIRWASRYGSPLTADAEALDVMYAWPGQIDNRATMTRYDASGHAVSSAQAAVAYGTVSATGALTTTTDNAITRTRFNFAGEVVRQTDANGNVIDFTLDAAGNRVLQQLPVFIDANGNAVRMTLEQVFDELGHVTATIERGTDNASIADDSFITTTYGVGGRLISQTDALGNTLQYGYDANGNLTMIRRSRNDADGNVINESIRIVYDAANRELKRWTVNEATGEGGITTETRYNVHGEVTGTRSYGGTNPPADWQRISRYDALGRAWLATDDKGQDIGYVYDANGNATLKLETQTEDLRCLADIASMLANPNVQRTVSTYDGRNQLVRVAQARIDAGHPDANLQVLQVNVSNVNAYTVNLAVGGSMGALSTLPAATAPSRGAGVPSIAGGMNVWTTIDWGYRQSSVDGFFFHLPAFDSVFGAYNARVVLDISRSVSGWVTSYGYDGDQYVSPFSFSDTKHAEQAGYGNPAQIYFNYNSWYTGYSLDYDTLSYTGQVYVTSLSDGKEVLAATINKSDSTHAQSGLDAESPVVGSNVIRLANGELIGARTGGLYYRVAGTGGPFQYRQPTTWLGVERPGSMFADLSGFAAGTYEMVLVVVGEDGSLMRRASYAVTIPTSGNPTVQVLPESNLATLPLRTGMAGGNWGTAVIRMGGVDFYNVHDTAGRMASNIRVKYRVAGSTGAYNIISAGQGTSPGAFQWSTLALGPNRYELVVELYDANWVRTGQLAGQITFDTVAVGIELAYYQTLPATLTFQNLPASATRLEIAVLSTGSGTTTNVTLGAAGLGSFVWDASALVPDPTLKYSYTLRYTAYDADGLVAGTGQGTAILGSTGSTTTLSGTTARVVTFDPAQPAAVSVQLRYRIKGQTATPMTVVSLPLLPSGRFKWQADSLDASQIYEYDYDALDASGKSLVRRFGTLQPDNVTTNDREVRWVIRTDAAGHDVSKTSSINIVRRQSYNAFGEIDTEQDGRGNITRFTYNTLGKLVTKTDPQVTNTLTNGTQQSIRPVTAYTYDRLGQVVATRDANGFLTTQVWNNGTGRAFVSATYQPDGGVERQFADVHGNIVVRSDALNRRTDLAYDANHQLVRLTRPMRADGARAVETWRYDSLGNRIAHTDALGQTDKTFYDADQRITATLSAAGRRMSYAYAWQNTIAPLVAGTGGWRKTTTDPNGRTLIDEADVFGHIATRTDLGSHVTTYTYNKAGAIARQTSSAGQDIRYAYYANGYLKSMVDATMNAEANYEYDANGNRVFEGYSTATSIAGSTARTVYFQQSTATYDALNRITRVSDPRYTIQYYYDAVGNRRRVLSTYNDGLSGTLATQDYWYRYDGLNRFTVTMGQLLNGGISAGSSGDGVAITYDQAGQRTSATYASDGHREDYSYTADGYLTDVRINGVLRTRRVNDLQGRVTRYQEWNTDGSARSDISRTWDADAQQTAESDSVTNSSTADTRMADGTLASTVQTSTSGGTTSTTTTDYAYSWWETARQAAMTVQTTGRASTTSQFSYDANGHLSGVLDPVANRGFTYYNDPEGRILRRDEVINGTKNRSHNYYFFDGHEIGNVGNDGLERKDYARQLAESTQGYVNPDDRFKDVRPVSAADFDENYQPINAEYPGAAPTKYTVKTGDSLQSIAQAVWGDSQMWYLIADANGLSGQETLLAGQVITIPNKVANLHNNASTFKVYEPGYAIGDTSPTIPAPPPPPKNGGCGGVGAVISAVVAVAVAAVTEQWYLLSTAAPGTTAAAAAAQATMGQLITAKMAGAVAGSIARQGVAIAAGIRDSFGWRQVGLSAITAGVSQGLLSDSTFAGSGLGKTVAPAMASNAIGQGLGTLLGMQKKLDWRAVAASGVGVAVGWAATEELDLSNPTMPKGEHLAKSALAGLAAGTASALSRGGPVSVQQVATDAFGNALGSALTSEDVLHAASDPTSFEAHDLPHIQETIDQFTWSDSQLKNGRTPDTAWNPPGVPDVDPSRIIARTLDGHFFWSTGSLSLPVAPPDITERPLDDLPKSVDGGIPGADVGLAARFGRGLFSALEGATVQPILQSIDLAKAAASVVYNEVFRGEGEPYWLPAVYSNVARAYEAGASRAAIVVGATPFLNVGVLAYDATIALSDRRFGDLAEIGGGLVGGFAIGGSVNKFGGYGIALADIGASGFGAYQRGTIGIKFLAPPEVTDGPFTPLVPGGGLKVHEELGGHLIWKHVGKEASFLQARLRDEPYLKAASTFDSRSEAETAISYVLSANRTKVVAWESTGARGTLFLSSPYAAGFTMTRESNQPVRGTSVAVTLKGHGQGRWKISTGYPEP